MAKKEVAIEETDEDLGNRDSMIDVREERRLLPCVLTDRERLEYGESMARTVVEIGKKEDERKAAAEKFKAELSDLERQKNIDARIISTGKIEREVEVRILLDYRACSVRVTRHDTGEVIEHRPMTNLERQKGMEF